VIRQAYHLTEQQISGGPKWLDSDLYDIEAKANGPATDDELRKMLQALLAERFGLGVHYLEKDLAVYVLVVDKGGGKLVELQEGVPVRNPSREPRAGAKIVGNIEYRGSVQNFADLLASNPAVGRPVLDRTGRPGLYVFALTLYSGEDLVESLTTQLGLRLVSERAILRVLVIDHIERPTAN